MEAIVVSDRSMPMSVPVPVSMPMPFKILFIGLHSR